MSVAAAGLPAGVRAALPRLVKAFLVLIAMWLMVLGLFNLRHPSDWAMGDWLINYSGGFVRRGLLGQSALLAQTYLHVPALWSVLLLQWGLYGILLRSVWLLLEGLRWTWWLAAFVFSPATLAFVLLDPPFAFRKEILLFAVLAGVSVWLMRRGASAEGSAHLLGATILLSLACVMCVLAHEGLLVYFPYLGGAAVIGLASLRRAAQLLAAPLLLSGGAFFLVSHHPGDTHTAQAVCAAIGGQLTDPPSGICGGAVAYLTRSPAYAHEEVRRTLLLSGFLRRLPWLFVLPFVPALLGLVRFQQRGDRLAVWAVTGSAVLAGALSVSLFYYGTDWTRWVYIHAVCLLLVMLLAERRDQQPNTMPEADLAKVGGRAWIGVFLLVLYATGWELTVYGQRPLYLSFVRFVTHQLVPGRQ